MTGLPWEYDDGGRAAAGYRGHTGDCVTRAVAIATGRDYQDVYADIHDVLREHKQRRGGKGSSSPRDGVPKPITRRYLANLGWEWTPTMRIGSGTRVHLRPGELPTGPLIVQVSGHITAVIDGVVRDTADPCRDGTRAVYGYWQPEETP